MGGARPATTNADVWYEEMAELEAFFEAHPGWGWHDYLACPKRIVDGLTEVRSIKANARAQRVNVGSTNRMVGATSAVITA